MNYYDNQLLLASPKKTNRYLCNKWKYFMQQNYENVRQLFVKKKSEFFNSANE